MLAGGITFIHLLQLIAAVAWLVPTLLFAPAVYRVALQRHTNADLLVAPYPAIGSVQIGFSLRWFIYPSAITHMGHDEVVFWSGLYTLSILSVLLVVTAGRAWWTR